MKSFVIAIGLVAAAARVEAQHLSLAMARVKGDGSYIEMSATDFGVVRVTIRGDRWEREIDAAPMAVRKFAVYVAVNRPPAVSNPAQPDQTFMSAELQGRGGSLTMQVPEIDLRVPRTLVVSGAGADTAIRVVIPGGTMSLFADYLLQAARETAALSLSPTGIDSSALHDYAFTDHQVEYPARLQPDQPGPPYPAALMAARVPGEVTVRFVVTPEGTVDTARVELLRATQPLFAEAVKLALAHQHFMPARIGQRLVAQWVEKSFQFRLPPT